MSRHHAKDSKRTEDYRTIWLKRNPGLLKCMWICAYCGLPIIGKSNLQVDHVVPVSRAVVQGNNAVTKAALAPATMVTKGVWNSQFNLVASHGGCNRKKSNKIDFRVIIGYFFKLLSFVASPAVWLINLVFFAIIDLLRRYWYIALPAGIAYWYFYLDRYMPF